MIDHRCQSTSRIMPGVTKKCIRAANHPEEDHVWVESRLVNAPVFMIAMWVDGQDDADVYGVTP